MFGKGWDWKDPIWGDFKKVETSQGFSVGDLSSEARVIYKITLMDDLPDTQRKALQFNFDYVRRIESFTRQPNATMHKPVAK